MAKKGVWQWNLKAFVDSFRFDRKYLFLFILFLVLSLVIGLGFSVTNKGIDSNVNKAMGIDLPNMVGQDAQVNEQNLAQVRGLARSIVLYSVSFIVFLLFVFYLWAAISGKVMFNAKNNLKNIFSSSEYYLKGGLVWFIWVFIGVLVLIIPVSYLFKIMISLDSNFSILLGPVLIISILLSLIAHFISLSFYFLHQKARVGFSLKQSFIHGVKKLPLLILPYMMMVIFFLLIFGFILPAVGLTGFARKLVMVIVGSLLVAWMQFYYLKVLNVLFPTKKVAKVKKATKKEKKKTSIK